jgi:hypothetical protein
LLKVTVRVVDARFEVFMAVEIQVEVFWLLTSRSVVAGYQRFGEPCCLCLYIEDGGSMVL